MGGEILAAEPQLFVTDLPAAVTFYREALGFDLAFAHGEPVFYAQVVRGGARLNLRAVDAPAFSDSFRRHEADALSATLVVTDAAALFAEWQARGVAFHQPLRREPWGAETFIVADPSGNLICVAGG